MLLMIDNYDSFTYNLVQYLGELGQDVRVVRNDAISVAEVIALAPQQIVISPGPCTPTEAGICVPLIQALAGKIPILGVCLGHQSIGAAFGANIVRAPTVQHGKTDSVTHTQIGVFQNIANPFTVARYHSLVIDPLTLPTEFDVTAHTADGCIMGIKHQQWKLEGVQFHPESIATEYGHLLLQNFLNDSLSPQ